MRVYFDVFPTNVAGCVFHVCESSLDHAGLIGEFGSSVALKRNRPWHIRVGDMCAHRVLAQGIVACNHVSVDSMHRLELLHPFRVTQLLATAVARDDELKQR